MSEYRARMQMMDALDMRIQFRAVRPKLTWNQRKRWIDTLRWMERRNARIFI